MKTQLDELSLQSFDPEKDLLCIQNGMLVAEKKDCHLFRCLRSIFWSYIYNLDTIVQSLKESTDYSLKADLHNKILGRLLHNLDCPSISVKRRDEYHRKIHLIEILLFPLLPIPVREFPPLKITQFCFGQEIESGTVS